MGLRTRAGGAGAIPSALLSVFGFVVLGLALVIAQTDGVARAAEPAAAEAAPKAKAAKPQKAPKAPKAGKTGAGGTGDSATGAGASDRELERDLPPSAPPAGASPLADLKKSNDQLDKTLRKKYPNWSPEAEAQKTEVRKLVGSFLDYRELARRALSKHWDTLTPVQRQEFVSTLRELVERSYLKQVRGDPNYTMKYDKETKGEGKDGSEATVEATLHTITRGKKVDIALVYKLVYKGHWLVYDVITDEQSMLENYRAEFNKIINKDGFPALLNRMKKKLDEKDE